MVCVFDLTGKDIRKMIKNNLIVRKPDVVHSRGRVNARLAAKAKGRHTGYGKRQGTRESRFPSKSMWIRRARVLRRFLRKYREQKKIDRHMHASLYKKAKGNVYKNKRVLMESIWHIKSEAIREKALSEQAKIRAARTAAKKAKVAKKLAAE